MTTAAEIKNEESLLAWLNARPEKTRKQDAVTIACRAALRALPLMAKDVERRAAESRDKLLFSSFRAISASWLYAGSGSQDAEIAAAAAARATADADAAAADAFWAAVRSDAEMIEGGGNPLGKPLWHDNDPPPEITAAWPKLKAHLGGVHGENWWVWTDWYQRRLDGTPFSEPRDRAYVFLEKEDWDKNTPAEINADIAKQLALLIAAERPLGENIGIVSPEGQVGAVGLAPTEPRS
ncbi:MAG: hypothetical protein AAF882_20910, partial [Pseudomonadota bacterium]